MQSFHEFPTLLAISGNIDDIALVSEALPELQQEGRHPRPVGSAWWIITTDY